MPVDNEIYNRPGDISWDECEPLNAIRTALNPARLAYFTAALRELGVDAAGKMVVDIGCGGGLFAEELARTGARVTASTPQSHRLRCRDQWREALMPKAPCPCFDHEITFMSICQPTPGGADEGSSRREFKQPLVIEDRPIPSRGMAKFW